MIRSTLTARGQTTIPAEVRRALKLKPHQGLIYELRGESVVVRPEGGSLLDLCGCLGGGVSRVRTDEDRERRDAAERDAVGRHVLAQNPPAGDTGWRSP